MTTESDVRLTLHEFLLETLFAVMTANDTAHGAAGLASMKDQIVRLMVEKTRHADPMTDEQREDWQVNAHTLTTRFFDKAEARRADIVRLRGSATPGASRS